MTSLLPPSQCVHPLPPFFLTHADANVVVRSVDYGELYCGELHPELCIVSFHGSKDGIYMIWRESGEIICDGNLPNEIW